MAATMKTCLSKLHCRLPSISSTRYYARKTTRSIQDVLSPDEDIEQSKRSQSVTDPRKNPYLAFEPHDPVQRSMRDAANRKDEILKVIKNPFKQKHRVKSRTTMGDYPKIRTPYYEDMSSPKSKKRDDAKWLMDGDAQNEVPFNFEKLEEEDKRFGRVIMRARSKKGREEHREIVLEGKNLIVDALTAGARLKVLYFSGAETMAGFPIVLLGDAAVFKVQYKHLKLWSEVETPQGLLGIFEMPPIGQALKPASSPIPLTLICDSIREGGNLGTLIRTAAAVGCHSVIALKGCVDIWNGKVLRSAAGCHFRVPIHSNITWSQLPSLLPLADNIKVFIADNNQMTDELRQSLTGTLEAVEDIEQLHMEPEETTDSDTEIGQSNALELDYDDNEDGGETEIVNKLKQGKLAKLADNVEEDDSYGNFRVLSAYRKAPVGIEMYDNVDYTSKHAVLVISGETSGISLPARKLAYDHYGECVTIPMEGEVESLNCAIAGSVIMYEVARQFRNVKVDTMHDDTVDN